MGDISEMRGLVVLATFISITGLLINALPAQFYAGSELVKEPPAYFESVDLQSFSSTTNFTLDKSHPMIYGWYAKDFTIGGWELRIYYRTDGTETKGLRIGHLDYFWIFPTGYHMLSLEDARTGMKISDGSIYEILTTASMAAHWDSGTNLLKVKASCSHTNFMVYMAYNTTKYASITEAFLDGGLACLVGVGLDQVNTSMNVWALFTSMLYFRIPAIHPAINALLTAGMWIAFAYIAGILMLRVIGGIMGGGA